MTTEDAKLELYNIQKLYIRGIITEKERHERLQNLHEKIIADYKIIVDK